MNGVGTAVATNETNEVMGAEGGGGHSLQARLGWMAGQIHSPRVSRGARAELRRMKADGVPPAVYWSLTAMLDPVPGEDDEPFWISVMALMATHPHAKNARPGKVLAEAGVKAARVERWLRREREDAWREARRLLSILGDKGFDWGVFGSLLYWWEKPESRRRFARDFFRTEAARQRSRSTSEHEPKPGDE